MADVITGASQVAATRGTVVSTLVQRNLIAQSKLIGTIFDVSQYAEEGADTIKFPKATNFTVTKKTPGVPVDAQALTYTTDDLVLDQEAVIQWLIEKRQIKQNRVNLEMTAIERAAAAHAKQVDMDIYAKLKLASASAPDNRIAFIGSTITKDDILMARLLLDQAEAPDDGNRFMALNPAEEKALLGLQDFIDASRYGSSDPIQNGEIGKIYNIRLVKTNVVTPGLPVIYHREALAFGLQSAPEYAEESALANLATRYSIDQLYGLKELQGGQMAVLLGSAT